MATRAAGDGAVSSEDRKLTARVDISKASEVDKVNLGDVVTICVTGKIRSMRGPDQSLIEGTKGKDKTYTYPGSIEVEIQDMTVLAEGEFEGLMEEY